MMGEQLTMVDEDTLLTYTLRALRDPNAVAEAVSKAPESKLTELLRVLEFIETVVHAEMAARTATELPERAVEVYKEVLARTA